MEIHVTRKKKQKVSGKICEFCNKTFHPHQISNIARFCSAVCYGLHRRTLANKDFPQEGLKARISRYGYKILYHPDHPNSYSDGYILEHRLIANDMVGGGLLKTDQVHHINGDKLDNAINNLMVMSASAHKKAHRSINGGDCE